MEAETYLGYLDSIRNDPDMVTRERQRLDNFIRELSSRIKANITPDQAPGLVWSLQFKELDDVRQQVEDPFGTRITELAQQARYLRGLVASVPFVSGLTCEDPRTDELLELCDELWHATSHREMLITLGTGTVDDYDKRVVAARMSLLGAIQLELISKEQAEFRVRRIFEPFSDEIVQPILGFSVDDILKAFETIRKIFKNRFTSAQQGFSSLKDKWSERRGPVDARIPYFDMMSSILTNNEREEFIQEYQKSDEIIDNALVFAPEDLEELLGEKSHAWLEAFSFVPGQVNQQFSTLFDDDAVRARPFARLPESKYLLMDLYYMGLAPLYRLPELFTNSKTRNRLTRRRDRVLEEDALALFSPVVNPTLKAINYYLPIVNGNGLAERDILLMHDGTALLIECKAKALRPVERHRGNVKKIESDIKGTIQSGYDQVCSAYDYLVSGDGDAILWDSDKSNKHELTRIKRSEVHEIFPIVVLDSYFGFLATDLKPWLRVRDGIGFPWVIDRNTLESIFTVLKSFDQLTEFLRWRTSLHGVAINYDEAVFAGFYLRHGPAKMPESANPIQLLPEYSDIFDATYFREKGVPIDIPEERTPPVWSEMKKDGDEIIFSIDGEFHDAVNWRTGRSHNDSVEPPHSGYPNCNLGTFPVPVNQRKIGPNEACPCGSGRKYKKCCQQRT